MNTNITKAFLQEHFKNHDTLTLYKQDGTPVTFVKQYKYTVTGGHQKFTFKDYDTLEHFYKTRHLSLNPVITIT